MSKGPGKWQALILDYLRTFEHYPLFLIAGIHGSGVNTYADAKYQALMRAARTLEKQGKVGLHWGGGVDSSGIFGVGFVGRVRIVSRPGEVDVSKPARVKARFAPKMRELLEQNKDIRQKLYNERARAKRRRRKKI